MTTYPIHTIDSAPDAAKPALTKLHQLFGFIPNLAGTMAASPVLLQSFIGAFGAFGGSHLTGAHRQALLLTNAVTNRCRWAVAFHSTLALREGVAPDDVAAIRERRLPQDRPLAALSGVTRALIEKRGHLDDRDRAAFTAAGFTDDHLFEVIAGLAVSTLANYTGNVTEPPLEALFEAQAWQP